MSAAAETWAVVAAGGSGTRLGADRPKAFVGLGGRPLLAHAIELFEAHEAVDGIVLVVPAAWQEPATLLADDLAAGKVAAAVAGGATRGESVAAGLTEVPDAADVILVHDAARPFASADLVTRVLAGLAEADGAIPAVALADTVKEVADGRVRRTLERASLTAVQTPQAFRAAALRRAFERAGAAVAGLGDCAAALEAAGMPVAVVDGEEANRKLTNGSDLRTAELLVSGGRR